jgi:hypothetical protein|tara:strand:+ start:93 stop:611 length:519 start_codon:yes stop_codon:yes gene_type:complete
MTKVDFRGSVTVNKKQALRLGFPSEYEGRYIVEPYPEGLKLAPTKDTTTGNKAALYSPDASRVYIELGRKTCEHLYLDISRPSKSRVIEMWYSEKNGSIYVPSLRTILAKAATHFDEVRGILREKKPSAPESLDRGFIKEMIDDLNDYRQHGLVMRIEDEELKGQIRIVEDI